MNEKTTEQILLPEDDLIPIGLVAAEIGEAVGWVAHHFGEAVTVDDVGLRSVRADDARRFFTERAEWKRRHIEDRERRRAEAEKAHAVPVGVPAQEGMSPFESMVAAGGGVVSPADEFDALGRERPRFLEEQLEAGARALAQKREQTEARKKQRAADQMKKDLQ